MSNATGPAPKRRTRTKKLRGSMADFSAPVPGRDERRWKILRGRFRSARFDEAIKGPDTDWVEVVPVSVLEEKEAAIRRLEDDKEAAHVILDEIMGEDRWMDGDRRDVALTVFGRLHRFKGARAALEEER
jgi:hypothetical protein